MASALFGGLSPEPPGDLDARGRIRWQVHEHVSVDLAYKRYLMQGLDDVTLSAAYPQANVFTMGIGFQW